MTFQYKDSITILGKDIKLGERYEANFGVAKLHTASSIDVPVIVERSINPGPVVLFTAGIHGDEVNGVEIIRQLIAKEINKPKCGTIICIPIINVFGFINLKREFPDGRDLNRVFPGLKRGSLASRVAYKLVHEIVNEVDFVIDFHTGGAERFNAPQIRMTGNNPELDELAEIFGVPFVMYSKHIKKSFRATCNNLGKPMLLFEGGKSFHIDTYITNTAVNGVKRVLNELGMLNSKFKVSKPNKTTVFVIGSRWQRAKYSGMFKTKIKICSKVNKGEVLGHITDPYGKFNHSVKAAVSGYIINVNESPIVYQGDGLFHISTQLK